VRIILFVEGETELYLPAFLARWLDARLTQRIEIKPVNLNGVGNYLRHFAARSRLALAQPGILAAVGLIDFYGSGLSYPGGTILRKYAWAKQQLEGQVSHERFRQHFVVHDTEAWLLADPSIFPAALVSHVPRKPPPEKVDSHTPPSHRLKYLYHRKLGKKYHKPVDGRKLFGKLDPEIAYARCPHLKLFLDELLSFAQAAEG
jgi:uncharacterized protein DUF4276